MMSLISGKVVKTIRQFFWVRIPGWQKLIKTQISGFLRHQKQQVIVGDLVEVEIKNQDLNLIKKRLKRKNELKRPLIANFDQVFIVFSWKEPELDFIFLNQILIWIAAKVKINPILIFTKTDLLQAKDDFLQEKVKFYQKYYATIILDQNQTSKIVELKKTIQGTSVFLGRSGVGKTTLFNLLSPTLNLKTKSVSKIKLGTHQTVFSQYFEICGQLVADTPGFNKITLKDLTKAELLDGFLFFSHCSPCHFQSCYHWHEPDCQVKKAISKSPLLYFFWTVWIKILTIYNKTT